jgi:D-glycero-D-manno-heptose 1,7-bisphosphate phosphatase
MNRAVFLDRDGTLIQEKNFLHRPDDVTLIPGTDLALKRLQSAGFLLFIVSNQSGVGRGYFTLADVEAVNQRLLEEVAPLDVHFQKIYIAPEAPGVESPGRKPSPQFLFDAREEFAVDLAESFMIGDKLSDLECGWNAGIKASILVRTGYGLETERRMSGYPRVPVIVESLPQAADWILAD